MDHIFFFFVWLLLVDQNKIREISLVKLIFFFLCSIKEKVSIRLCLTRFPNTRFVKPPKWISMR